MSLFAIADLHLSLGADKSMTVFEGWNDYTARLQRQWAECVGPDDTVVVAGDISWGMTLEEAKEDFIFLHRLPGQKVILKGNHDYWWTSKTKMEKFLEEKGLNSIKILHNNSIAAQGAALCGTRGWIYDGSAPADQKVILREAARLKTSLEAGKKLGLEILCFLHYPPVYANETCREIAQVLEENAVKRCYYGHIHGRAQAYAVQGDYRGMNLQLIAADYLRFCPLPVAVQSV